MVVATSAASWVPDPACVSPCGGAATFSSGDCCVTTAELARAAAATFSAASRRIPAATNAPATRLGIRMAASVRATVFCFFLAAVATSPSSLRAADSLTLTLSFSRCFCNWAFLRASAVFSFSALRLSSIFPLPLCEVLICFWFFFGGKSCCGLFLRTLCICHLTALPL